MFLRGSACILLTLLVPLSSFLTDATPTSTTTTHSFYSPNNTATSLDEVLPYCFNETSHPGIGTTNSNDCREALRKIYRDPNGNKVYRFSKNRRSSIDVIHLPRGWQYNECVIYVSCSNDRDAAYFTILDVAKEAVKVIRDCVDRSEPKYGGIADIGNVATFYVSVGRPVNPRRASSTLSGPPAEATLVVNSTLVQAALSDFFDDNSGVTAES